MPVGTLPGSAIRVLRSELKGGGEGANRTLPGPRSEPTTVLKTAGATRHPSLSGANRGSTPNAGPRASNRCRRTLPRGRFPVLIPDHGIAGRQRPDNERASGRPLPRTQIFALIVLRSASKSGNPPVSALEWTFWPLRLTSKTPPLEGTSFNEPIRCFRVNSLSARPTALGS